MTTTTTTTTTTTIIVSKQDSGSQSLVGSNLSICNFGWQDNRHGVAQDQDRHVTRLRLHAVHSCSPCSRHKSQLQDYFCEEMGLILQCMQITDAHSSSTSLDRTEKRKKKILCLLVLMKEKPEDEIHWASLYDRTDMCFTAQQEH